MSTPQRSNPIAAWSLAVLTLGFLAVIGCQKKYTTAPLAPPVLTPTPTITLSPTVTFTPPAGPNANCAEVPIVDLTGYVNGAPYVGDTASATDEFFDDTAGTAGVGIPDDLFVLTVFQRAYYTFSLCGTAVQWDSYIYLRTNCDNSATNVGLNDDSCGNTLSSIETALDPGVYYLIIDGLGQSGAYQLSVTAGPIPPP